MGIQIANTDLVIEPHPIIFNQHSSLLCSVFNYPKLDFKLPQIK